MLPQASRFASLHWSVPEDQVSVSPLHGGLESAVGRARAGAAESFVVKELRGTQRREANLYRELFSRYPWLPMARLLGAEAHGESEFLYLEDVGTENSWPWPQIEVCAAVCRLLARVHDSGICPSLVIDWDYESELRASAESTLAAAVRTRDEHGGRVWRRPGDLRRVVRHLDRMRAALLNSGSCFIHGDVHPGNVIVRAGTSHQEPIVMIDWARARVGSPLEDVSSWLHSLACWVPEARRRHDTLLQAYLRARQMPLTLNSSLRVQFYFASACNGLSGAIRYYVSVSGDPLTPAPARALARQGLAAWERLMRHVAGLLGAR